MSTQATISALQAIHEAILAGFHTDDGATHAPDGTEGKEVPAQAEEAYLPLCILRPGPYDLAAAGRGVIQGGRSYRGAVIVLPRATAQGIERLPERIPDVWAILDAFRERYIDLVATSEVLSSGDCVTRYRDTTRDSTAVEGTEVLAYRRRVWLGFTFSVDVWEAE